MKRDDPRGRRDPVRAIFCATTSPLFRRCPVDFSDRLQAHLLGIDAGRVTGRASVASDRLRPAGLLLAAAALVALAVALVVVGRHTAGEYLQPEPASAAQVVARAWASLSGFRTISATVSIYWRTQRGPLWLPMGSKWTTSAQYFALARVKGPLKARRTPQSPPRHRPGASRDSRRPCRKHLSKPDPQGKLRRSRRDRAAGEGRDEAMPGRGRGASTCPPTQYTSPGYSYAGQGEIAIKRTCTPLSVCLTPRSYTSTWATMRPFYAPALLANGTVSKTTYDGRPALVVSAAVTPGPRVVNVEDGPATP